MRSRGRRAGTAAARRMSPRVPPPPRRSPIRNYGRSRYGPMSAPLLAVGADAGGGSGGGRGRGYSLDGDAAPGPRDAGLARRQFGIAGAGVVDWGVKSNRAAPSLLLPLVGEGVMRSMTDEGSWEVPTQRGALIRLRFAELRSPAGERRERPARGNISRLGSRYKSLKLLGANSPKCGSIPKN